MPVEIVNRAAAGEIYENPFLGAPGPIVNLKIDVSTLTTDYVDANGVLKPGTPVLSTGALAGTGAGQTAFGVTVEAQKLVGRTNNANLGTDTNDIILAVSTSGTINRDIAEDNIGRAYSANELAALAAGGFKVTPT